MGKYINNSVIEKLLLVAVGALVITIYVMTTSLGDRTSVIESRLDTLEAVDVDLIEVIAEIKEDLLFREYSDELIVDKLGELLDNINANTYVSQKNHEAIIDLSLGFAKEIVKTSKK